jgi:hypothetical protein
MPPAGYGIAQAPLAPATNERLDLSRSRKVLGDECSHPFIRILERPTRRTASVLWRNPGHRYYADQLWVRGVAGYGGPCALSRRSIKRDDRIYRPRQGKLRPLNAFAMILASVIEVGNVLPLNDRLK